MMLEHVSGEKAHRNATPAGDRRKRRAARHRRADEFQRLERTLVEPMPDRGTTLGHAHTLPFKVL